MRKLSILYVIAICFFSVYAAESEENSPKNRLRRTLYIDSSMVEQKKITDDSVTSPSLATAASGDSLNSLLSPKLFTPENVLKTLTAEIKSLQNSIKTGPGTDFANKRNEYLAFEKYRLERELAAAEKRCIQEDSVCDILKKEYHHNELLYDSDCEVYTKIEDLVPEHITRLAKSYGINEPLSILKQMDLYSVYCHVKKDWTLTDNARKKWQQVFDLVLTRNACENYSSLMINCTFKILRFNEIQQKAFDELKEQFNQINSK